MKWQTSSVHLSTMLRTSGSSRVFWAEPRRPRARASGTCSPTREELGDRRPSQLLNTMPQLVGSSNMDSKGAILKELFLQHLPQLLQGT
ncbi:hypothetical protein HPB48_006095 [Haemaphysalis longicornis]|uniref:Uncharacterized protein n=1 Tax=Haemaphysalis longicornis TaxID=44386 RepID=A0A9J6F9U4_HAELO|nr:hypothetical protein HPB48_006095 [Haemaphysalis longicornis]